MELEENIPFIIGDSQRIGQLIINLLTNACEALDSKDKGISIKTEFDNLNSKVILYVSDEGCGIPTNKLKNIFDPFFTLRQDKGGTGLGLSIVQSIVDEHDAEINLTSNINMGTTVTIKFPV